MNTMLRRGLILVVCMAAQGVCLFAQNSTSPPTPAYWKTIPPFGEGYFSAAYVERRGSDGLDDLRGMSISWGGWGEDPYRFGISKSVISAVGVHFRLSEVRNSVQDLWSAGLGADLAVLMLGPVRVFPRLSLGATYRNADPDQGWGAVGSLGLGTAVWLGHHWQAVVAADRDYDFGAPDSSRYTLEVRWLSEKLGFPIAE